MIYLFNSAYRPLYAGNVLNTIFLPSGATNIYRYRFRDPENVTHVSPERVEWLKAAKGMEVSISFIDKSGPNGYKYHPLRLGTLMRCWEEGQRLLFQVQLKELIAAQNASQFSDLMLRALESKNIARLNGTSENSHDGYYVIDADSLFNDAQDFRVGPSAWGAIVEQLSHAREFESSATRQVLFARVELVRHTRNFGRKRETRLSAKPHADVSRICIERGVRYELRFSYSYPIQHEDVKATAVGRLTATNNLQDSVPTSFTINSSSNTVILPFASKRYPEEDDGKLKFEFEPSNSHVELVAPDADIRLYIRNARFFWFQALVAIALFAIGALVVGANFSTINPLTLQHVAAVLWVKLLFAILQSVALLWLFHLLGKKAI